MVTAAVLALPAAASAGYPGANGKIFFDVGGGSGAAIFSIQPDGSDRQRLIDRGREPAVSADGRQIVFMRGGDLYLATRSGSDIVQVTDTAEAERNPSFSPSGNKLLFATDSTGGKPGHIFTMRTDGGDRTRLTQSQRRDSDPSFSPTGNEVVFVRVGTDAVSQLYKMDTDGTNINQLTSGEFACEDPTWSPDGDRIAFKGFDGPAFSLFALNPNGEGLDQLTQSELGDHEPDYSPSGRKVVFRGARNDRKGLFIVGTDGGTVERLTSSEPGNGVGVDGDPYWGPTP